MAHGNIANSRFLDANKGCHLQEAVPSYQTIAPPFIQPPPTIEPPPFINSVISTETEEIQSNASAESTLSPGNDFLLKLFKVEQ
jgi:hypothetical protein